MDWMSARGPEPEVSDEEIVRAVKQTMAEKECPVAGTRDIALQLGVSGQTIRNRMEQLEEQGEIKREKIGGGPVIYWPADG